MITVLLLAPGRLLKPRQRQPHASRSQTTPWPAQILHLVQKASNSSRFCVLAVNVRKLLRTQRPARFGVQPSGCRPSSLYQSRLNSKPFAGVKHHAVWKHLTSSIPWSDCPYTGSRGKRVKDKSFFDSNASPVSFCRLERIFDCVIRRGQAQSLALAGF